MSKPKRSFSVLEVNLKKWRRKNKGKRGYKFPKAIVQQVVDACKAHGVETVCERIDLRFVDRWRRAVEKDTPGQVVVSAVSLICKKLNVQRKTADAVKDTTQSTQILQRFCFRRG